MENKLSLGIDIGTTTLSMTVVDVENRCQLKAYTYANDSNLTATEEGFKEQNPEWILAKVEAFLNEVMREFPNIQAIGFTGQMHGMLYVDENGNAVSPLVTWQDGRGNFKQENGMTYCEEIEKISGRKISTGFGYATHYYNTKQGLVPERAATFCTIMDYLVMRITGNTTPLIHASNAASLGLFSVEKSSFYSESISQLGIDNVQIPKVTKEIVSYGIYQGIPVFVAIGDNQASLFGTVQNDTDILVNYGTGSQISVITDRPEGTDEMEVRPFVGEKFLLSGSAICGGRAYAMLEHFFKGYLKYCGFDVKDQYEVMNRMAEEAYQKENAMKVSTTFCGTRINPKKKGNISEIDEMNFTPEALTLGVLQGMVDELYDMYVGKGIEKEITSVIASGNAVRKNPVLQKLLEDKFQVALKMPAIKEEAAFGAALCAAVYGGLDEMEEIKGCIKYV